MSVPFLQLPLPLLRQDWDAVAEVALGLLGSSNTPASSSSRAGATGENHGSGLLGTKIQILDIEPPEAILLYKGYSLLGLLK